MTKKKMIVLIIVSIVALIIVIPLTVEVMEYTKIVNNPCYDSYPQFSNNHTQLLQYTKCLQEYSKK
jgi:hypothetical protein